jgi:hypothetical protein
MKIEKNIPMLYYGKHDFVREMEVGDSVFYEDLKKARSAVSVMRRIYGGMIPESHTRKYRLRKLHTGGARIWRTE